MNLQGPGKIWAKDSDLRQSGFGGGPTVVEVEAHLYNFDIDVSTLKEEHKRFLNEKIVPALKANKYAVAILKGSASRSGEHNHNSVLSAARAQAVNSHLAASSVGGNVGGVIPLGDPRQGPKEEERDRAVFLVISFPLVIDDLSIRTDDWTRELFWNDIIGLGAVDKKELRHLNIEVRASGVPRVWNLDGGKTVRLMPDPFPLQALGARSGKFIDRKDFPLNMAPAAAQANDLSKTLYRDSGTLEQMGFGPPSTQPPGVATIARPNAEISLGLIKGTFNPDKGWKSGDWESRGSAILGGSASANDRRPDAKRLLEAGGVEVLTLEGRHPKEWRYAWLARSPADVFSYSGGGTKTGCLSQAGECWASPEAVLAQWHDLADMKALLMSAPYVLQMNVSNGFAIGGPGAKWAPLLDASVGGPLTALLGYRDEAPRTEDVGREIARKMGEKIAAGLKDDEWVKTWLSINAEHPGKNTWNAVGMDQRGYWWIEARSAWSRSFDFVPFISGSTYKILGPAPMP